MFERSFFEKSQYFSTLRKENETSSLLQSFVVVGLDFNTKRPFCKTLLIGKRKLKGLVFYGKVSGI